MPAALRSRLALIGLLGIFLIPLATSSLRGLTHILTCEEPARIDINVTVPRSGPPTILSASTIDRGQERGVCGGLVVNPAVGPAGPGRVLVTVPITNNTEHAWQGTVQLKVDETSFPIDIGEIGPGETEADIVTLNVDRGSHQISGTLLIGP